MRSPPSRALRCSSPAIARPPAAGRLVCPPSLSAASSSLPCVVTLGLELAVAYLNTSRGVPWMFALFVVLVVGMNYALTRTQVGPLDDRRRRQSRSGAPRRHQRQGHLHQRLRLLLDVRRARRHAGGLAPGLGQPAGRHRRRQPQRHRGGGDRRHQPVRWARQRLFGSARHHRHPVHRQRTDPARSELIASLHDHRRRAGHRGDRRLPGAPLARCRTAAPDLLGRRLRACRQRQLRPAY